MTVHRDAMQVDHIGDAFGDATHRLDRRVTASQTPHAADDAAVERVVQRIGAISELSEDQVRAVAAIALVAMSVDDADRQRRDHAARENRRRLQRLGRD